MSVTQGELAGVDPNGLRLHLFTDDGQVNLSFLRAPAVPREGETLALGGVIHRVESVHWTFEPATVGFSSTSDHFFYERAHVRLVAVAQEGAPAEVLR